MTFLEGIVTLIFGALIGGGIGWRLGVEIARLGMQSESYRDLKRERDTLRALVNTAIETAEAYYVHHNCKAKPVEQPKPQTEDEFEDWIPG